MLLTDVKTILKRTTNIVISVQSRTFNLWFIVPIHIHILLDKKKSMNNGIQSTPVQWTIFVDL